MIWSLIAWLALARRGAGAGRRRPRRRRRRAAGGAAPGGPVAAPEAARPEDGGRGLRAGHVGHAGGEHSREAARGEVRFWRPIRPIGGKSGPDANRPLAPRLAPAVAARFLPRRRRRRAGRRPPLLARAERPPRRAAAAAPRADAAVAADAPRPAATPRQRRAARARARPPGKLNVLADHHRQPARRHAVGGLRARHRPGAHRVREEGGELHARLLDLVVHLDEPRRLARRALPERARAQRLLLRAATRTAC